MRRHSRPLAQGIGVGGDELSGKRQAELLVPCALYSPAVFPLFLPNAARRRRCKRDKSAAMSITYIASSPSAQFRRPRRHKCYIDGFFAGGMAYYLIFVRRRRRLGFTVAASRPPISAPLACRAGQGARIYGRRRLR